MIPSKRQPGDKILASDQNAMVDAQRRAQLITGDGLTSKSGPGGTGLFTEPFGAKSFWGRITALGPDNDADYTDERYWVKQIYITNAAGDSLTALGIAEVILKDINGDTYTPTSGTTIIHGYHVTATNLAEIEAGTHTMAVGTPVHVYMVYDSRDSANVHYIFTSGFAKGTSDNPDIMGPTPEGSESASVSPSASASASADTTDGKQLNVITRVVYNEAGDEILYGYYRTLLFDSVGLLVSVSDETRYTIDTPGACP